MQIARGTTQIQNVDNSRTSQVDRDVALSYSDTKNLLPIVECLQHEEQLALNSCSL